ncbi:hypothetical protein K492DRAFT_209274 [Lichtheimia hyalospora FSU 10163]|nr:hypothetical protein K492DRAFT_209274 [Lichtheimia hyalospora FSU 10163]
MMLRILSCLLLLLAVVSAAPGPSVYNPEIYVPNSDTVWKAGETYTVEWSKTSKDGRTIPEGHDGMIKLGYVEEGSIDEHLYWDLAAGFPLNSGSWNVTLPDNLAARSDYIIVVFGNSGNASPKFTIQSH